MNVAKVRYVGRSRIHSRRGPSGETYNFKRGEWVEVADLDDAKRFERGRNIEVEWTVRGKLYAHGLDVLEWGYQKKRSLASELDLAFDGQPDEDELEESLEEHIRELQEKGEI